MNREYYTCEDRIYCISDGISKEVTENDTDLVIEIFYTIENFYPEVAKALKETYSKSSLNLSYYRYLIVRRFIKCNFGNLDTTDSDHLADGTFNFEKVSCPMRGECKLEGIVCMPKVTSKLTDAENRVMELYYHNESIDKIADTLYLSGHTVRNHIKNVYSKLGVHSQGEFITYANRHKLYK